MKFTSQSSTNAMFHKKSFKMQYVYVQGTFFRDVKGYGAMHDYTIVQLSIPYHEIDIKFHNKFHAEYTLK